MVRHSIDVQRKLDPVPPMIGDRHKTLQILVNLLRNAKQAMVNNGARGKQLTLRVQHEDGGPVRITVRDNGMGIPRENLSRIFSHGFTTKPNGHGFGLHISALAAREMGGALVVESDGPEQGASFTLELPLAPAEAARTAADAISADSFTPPASPAPVHTAPKP
jgi:two-component system, NtrC family, sensor kinase